MEFADDAAEDLKSGEVIEYDVKVDIVTVFEELEDYEIEEYKEAGTVPESRLEIHITPVNTNILVEGNDND